MVGHEMLSCIVPELMDEEAIMVEKTEHEVMQCGQNFRTGSAVGGRLPGV